MPNRTIQFNFNNDQAKEWVIRIAKISVIFCFTAFLLYWTLKLLSPFILAIAFGFIIYRIFAPMHTKIQNKFKNYGPKFTAGLSTGIVAISVLGPLIILLVLLSGHVIVFLQQTFTWVQNGGIVDLINNPNIPQLIKDSVLSPFQEYLKSINIETILKEINPSVIRGIGGNILFLTSYLFLIILHFTLMTLVIFYGFYNGEKLLQNLLYLIPMKKEYKERYLTKLDETVRAVIVGGVLTALVQVFFGLIGFGICHIPIFWAFIMGFATAIPFVGAAIIWVPVCLYLGIKGQYGYAISLAIYCAIFVSSLDNFIRPYFISLTMPKDHLKTQEDNNTDKVGVYITFLFAILGGLTILGPSGLIFGPIIFSLWKISVDIYKTEFKDILEQRNNENDETENISENISNSIIPPSSDSKLL